MNGKVDLILKFKIILVDNYDTISMLLCNVYIYLFSEEKYDHLMNPENYFPKPCLRFRFILLMVHSLKFHNEYKYINILF